MPQLPRNNANKVKWVVCPLCFGVGEDCANCLGEGGTLMKIHSNFGQRCGRKANGNFARSIKGLAPGEFVME